MRLYLKDFIFKDLKHIRQHVNVGGVGIEGLLPAVLSSVLKIFHMRRLKNMPHSSYFLQGEIDTVFEYIICTEEIIGIRVLFFLCHLLWFFYHLPDDFVEQAVKQ